jgi:sugar O-acyltransferase (sialic acid O-acetyltransferase NeuD family)
MLEKNKFVVWGSKGLAKVTTELIELSGGEVLALFDRNRNVTTIRESIPIYYGNSGFQSWLNKQLAKKILFGVVAIGGSFGKDRRSIQKVFHENGIVTPSLIHPAAVVSPSARIGQGSLVLSLANIAADVEIDEAALINHRASVDHGTRLGKGVHVAPGATICGSVIIGDDVLVGAGSVILPRVSIGSNAIIGAGAVVTKDVGCDKIVKGNPAR